MKPMNKEQLEKQIRLILKVEATDSAVSSLMALYQPQEDPFPYPGQYKPWKFGDNHLIISNYQAGNLRQVIKALHELGVPLGTGDWWDDVLLTIPELPANGTLESYKKTISEHFHQPQEDKPAGFSYISKKSGRVYYPHTKEVSLSDSGRTQTIYYFSPELSKKYALSSVPEGFEVTENKRTGLPFLRRPRPLPVEKKEDKLDCPGCYTENLPHGHPEPAPHNKIEPLPYGRTKLERTDKINEIIDFLNKGVS